LLNAKACNCIQFNGVKMNLSDKGCLARVVAVFMFVGFLSLSVPVGCEAYIDRGMVPVPEAREAYSAFLEKSRLEAWEAVKSGFEENFDYDNDISLGPVTGRERQLGAVPFVRNYLVPVFQESVPTAGERKSEVKVRVASGEVEPVSFGLYALNDLDAVTAEMLEWQGKTPGTFEICWVECAPVRHGESSSTKKYQVQPVRLWPVEEGETFTVKARNAFQFWGTLRIREEVRPGKYILPVRVKSGDQVIYTLKLTVEVLPFELPRAKAAFGVYEANMISVAEMADLVDHGCNSITMLRGWPNYIKGAGVYDLAALDVYLRVLRAAGLDHTFNWVVFTKSYLRNYLLDDLGQEGLNLLLEQLDAGVASGDYPRNLALNVDEAISANPEFSKASKPKPGTVGNRWEDFVWLMNLIEEKYPHLKRLGTSMSSHEAALLHEGLIDILNCNGSLMENGSWCKAEGIDMYTYGSFDKCVYPVNVRFNAGFFPWRAGGVGTYCWAYKWYEANPFNDFDGDVMDWVLTYPGPEGTLISTPAWEAFREGVDDRRYLELYESLVAGGLADGTLLDRLRNKLEPQSVLREERIGDSRFGAILGNAETMLETRESLIDAILEALDE
jgi:hypothetical protein